MPFGYTGKILRINVSDQSYREETIDEKLYRLYMGGSCLAAHYLLKEQKAHIDPLSADNLLIFITGVVTGAPVPGSAIFSVLSKSPLTGGLHESPTPGYMGGKLKIAGYDGVIIKGKAQFPILISISNNIVEFMDASDIWGLNTAEAIDKTKKRVGEDASVCAIGISGEKQVKYASIVHDYLFNTSRGGLGAVMGSKLIKAIAVRGKGTLSVYNSRTLRQYSERFKNHFLENPVNKGQYEGGGHAGFINWMCKEGILSTRNAHYTGFKKAESIDGSTMAAKYGYENISCTSCFGGCKRRYRSTIEDYDNRYGAPELETLSSIAVGSEIDDMKSALKACNLTSRYGLDGTSTGVVLAFANECFEENLITLRDTGSIRLGFGNGAGAVSLIERIAHREGIGDVLAEGVASAADSIGKVSKNFALHVKGMEVPLHDPRIKAMLGLGYAVNPNGPIYTTVEHDTDFDFSAPELFMRKVTPLTVFHRLDSHSITPEKVRMFSLLQPAFSMLDAVGACIFAFSPVRYFDFRDLVGIIEAITGLETSLFELYKVGERRTNMFKMFNVREGFAPDDDRLPERYFHPIEKGPKKKFKLNKTEFEKAKNIYYKMAGWDDRSGYPIFEKQLELGIEEFSKV
jgi:aldehyde:ferredoxin oxidoreductase